MSVDANAYVPLPVVVVHGTMCPSLFVLALCAGATPDLEMMHRPIEVGAVAVITRFLTVLSLRRKRWAARIREAGLVEIQRFLIPFNAHVNRAFAGRHVVDAYGHDHILLEDTAIPPLPAGTDSVTVVVYDGDERANIEETSAQLAAYAWSRPRTYDRTDPVALGQHVVNLAKRGIMLASS